MLFNFQFPFFDLRGYLNQDTHRIHQPSWPHPKEGEFIRACGSVSERKRKRRFRTTNNRRSINIQDGLPKPIFGEENVYCLAKGFVKFPTLHNWGELQCAFRRIFSDPTGVSRLDLGFKVDLKSLEHFHEIQQALFSMPLCFQSKCAYNSQDSPCNCRLTPLYSAGPEMGEKYLESTTYRKFSRSNQIPNYWIQLGKPMLVAIFSAKEKEWAEEICSSYSFVENETPTFTPSTYQLFHHRHFLGRKNNRKMEAWYIICQDTEEGSDQVVRNFRINLLRLHAEKNGLFECTRMIQQKKLELPSTEGPQTPQSIALQQYINDSIYTLLSLAQSEQDADPYRHILVRTLFYDYLANPEDHERIMGILELMSPDAFKKLQLLFDRNASVGLKKQLETYIAKLQIEEALELLKEASSQSSNISFSFNEILQLQSQWNELSRNIRLKTIYREEAQVQQNQLVESLLAYKDLV